MKFLDIKADMVKEIIEEIKEAGITKVFFSDLNVESIDAEGFDELREEKDVFLIDHHPTREDLKKTKNIIKTVSEDCASLVNFVLGEEFIDSEEWGWLVCAAIFADYAFRSEKNFRFLQTFYPETRIEDISSSTPGINARRISSALIYYKNDIPYVYNLIKEKKIEELAEIHEIIEEEVYRIVDDFDLNKEYYPKNDIYFYEIKSKFDVLSYVATLIAGADPEKNFLFMFISKDVAKFSARSSSQKIDMGDLLKKSIQGLVESNGGGHVPAAGASVKLEDAEIFKRRVLG
jgi:single-stranded DNA-specific DHH superfamily exonuclease